MIDAIDLALNTRWPRPRPGLRRIQAPSRGPAHLKAVGVADFLLVKQQIKRYEAGEIAHIENLLAGESKTRTHRQLDRTEDVFTTVKEQQHEKETELQTTERFELNRESTKTLEIDQKFGCGLTLSGKYCPTVEFSSNSNLSGESRETDVQKNAVIYAKEIVERSKERIVETMRTERRLKRALLCHRAGSFGRRECRRPGHGESADTSGCNDLQRIPVLHEHPDNDI
jgi:hypothetical protein